MEIQQGIKNALISKLEVTLAHLNNAQDHFIEGELDLGNEDLELAKNKLIDFIGQVEAQRGKGIRDQDADVLVTDAQEIIDLIDEAMV